MEEEKIVHIDLRPLRPPPENPRADDGGARFWFAVLLLLMAIGFAFLGVGRLVLNVAVGAQDDWGWLFVIDRSVPAFTASAVFALASGVWYGRD